MNCFLANGQELEFYKEVAGMSPWPPAFRVYVNDFPLFSIPGGRGWGWAWEPRGLGQRTGY